MNYNIIQKNTPLLSKKMTVWYTVFNDQFWVVIAGMVCAGFGKLVNSRCRNIRICGPAGLIACERSSDSDEDQPPENETATPTRGRSNSMGAEIPPAAALQMERNIH